MTGGARADRSAGAQWRLARCAVTALAVGGVLAASIAIAAAHAWQVDPVAGPPTFLAADSAALAGEQRRVAAWLVGPRAGPPLAGQILFIRDPGGQWLLRPLTAGGTAGQPLVVTGGGELAVQFRLSPQNGFPPLEAVGHVFVFQRSDRVALVDLEPLRRSDRYELETVRGRWLRERLDGRTPIYVASVEPESYGRLRGDLNKRSKSSVAAWPAGPLLMWDRSPNYHSADRERGVRRSLRGVFNLVGLAVLAPTEDNSTLRRLFQRQGVAVIGWPAERAGRDADPAAAGR